MHKMPILRKQTVKFTSSGYAPVSRAFRRKKATTLYVKAPKNSLFIGPSRMPKLCGAIAKPTTLFEIKDDTKKFPASKAKTKRKAA